MANSGLQMLKAAAASGYSFQVAGLEGWNEYPGEYDYQGDSVDKAWAASKLEGCGANIWIQKEGAKSEWAMFIHVNDPEETLADFSCDGFIEAWSESTEHGQRAA